MKRSKKVWLIISSGFVALGIILMCAGGAMADMDPEKLFDSKRTKETLEFRQEFNKISIDTGIDDIQLIPSEDKGCYIELYNGKKGTYNAEIKGDTLKIKYSGSKEWYDYISFGYLPKKSIKVYVPLKEYESVKLDTGIGDIKIDKSFRIKALDADTGIGDIKAPKAEKENLSTGIGDITVYESSGYNKYNINADTGIGSIAVPEKDGRTDYNLDTGIGDIKHK